MRKRAVSFTVGGWLLVFWVGNLPSPQSCLTPATAHVSETNLITPNQGGVVQVDRFPDSRAVCEMRTLAGTETLTLSGPTEVRVFFTGPNGGAADTDGDGLDQVQTEMVQLDLTGMSRLGQAMVRLRDPSKSPFRRTLGEIEETVNIQPGRLDVPPFGPVADSYFDVFFESRVGGLVLHNEVPKRMRASITRLPPAPEETYFNPDVIQMFDENGNPTMVRMAASSHTPRPVLKPAGTDQVDSVAVFSFFDVGGQIIAVSAQGPTRMSRNDPQGDSFQSEIVQMNLFGLDSRGNAIQCIENRERPSPGHTTLTQLPNGNWAVDSFFDVFVEVFVPGPPKSGLQFQRLRNTVPIHLEAQITAVPPLGQAYSTGPTFQPVPLLADDGTEAGRLTQFMLFIGQPTLFSVAADGSSGFDPADILALGPTPTVAIPRASLGLLPGDDIDALSDGRDFLSPRFQNFPRFSVDRDSMGMPGSAVRAEATSALPEAHGDEFGLKPFGPDDSPCVGSGPNYLCYDENGFPGSLTAPTLGLVISDDLDGLMEALPDRISSMYFSLAPGSPTLAALGAGPGDILVSSPGGTPAIYARAESLGLRRTDDIDALCLMESGDGRYNPSEDEVRFSVSRASARGTIGPADILRPGPSVVRAASELGLRSGRNPDNLNALKCRALP